MTTSKYREPPEYLDKIGNKIVDAAFQVHKGGAQDYWNNSTRKHFLQSLRNMDSTCNPKYIFQSSWMAQL